MNTKNLSSNSLSPRNRSKMSPQTKRKSPSINGREMEQVEGQQFSSPLKYLLQNSININQGRQGERSPQQIEVISNLLRDCFIFKDLEIDLADSTLCKQLCNGIVLIYCQSPHIMEIKQNEIYVFFQGQGFEYMENGYAAQTTKKYKLYENNEYVMLRKIHTNQYFFSIQEVPTKYHANPKKCQLMVDQNTLIGKFSERIFYKVFNLKLKERLTNFTATMKKVQIFSGFPNTFFHQLSKFLFQEKALNGSKVLNRGEKCKFVYFLKAGSAQIRYFNQTTGKTVINSTQNYYISNNRPYTCSTLKPFDSFGMQTQDLGDLQSERQVICLSDCNFLKIQKRLLAILITSFEIDFQNKNKMWSQVNINNQIKGQNYCSPQKQLLLKNVQRIRTSQRKIRDLKLRYLSSNKIKKQEELGAVQKQQSFKQTFKQTVKIQQEQKNQRQILPQQQRRMIKTTEGRFRSTTVLKYINTFGGLQQDKKYDAIRRKMGEDDFAPNDKVNQIEFLAVDIDQPKTTDRLKFKNALEIRQKLEKQRSTRSSFKIQKEQPSHKFIPKLQVKTKNNMYNIRQDSDIIGVFLDKKMKSQIVKKAEKIMNMNRNAKLAENKNLKRIFASCSSRQLNAISEAQRKSIADDIVERMTNLKDNPLLLHIQKERKKQQQQMKIAEKARVSPQVHKKIKKEDHMILINNQQQ